MICPKCESGSLLKIKFRENSDEGYACDTCETVWDKEEDVSTASGHASGVFKADRDLDCVFDELKLDSQVELPVLHNF